MTIHRLSALLLLPALAACAALRAQTTDDVVLTARELAQGHRDGYVIAMPRAGSLAAADAAEVAEGMTVHRRFDRLGGMRVLRLKAGDTPEAAIARLKATGRYAFVEPDYIRRAVAVSPPNDPGFGEQWGLNNTGSNTNIPGPGVAGADIHALDAWATRTSAAGVIVAVIDSGALLTHNDLAGNLWVNPQAGKDGYTGDVNGINVSVSPATGDPTDNDGHGTHVSGIIGAVPNNGIAVSGVAWNVQLMELKFLNASGSGVISNEITCINYAISHGAGVINASFGSTDYSASEYTAIQAAAAAGIVFVAAAGNNAEDNDLTPNYPASYPLDNIVSVACSDNRDDAVFFTSYGSGIADLFAPGYNIYSLYNTGNSATAILSGTSMSAPFVAGAVALLRAQFPGDTYRQIINRLLSTVDANSNFTGKAQTGGRLNLAAALASTSNTPFNDAFARRAHLAGTSFTVRSNSAGASREAGEPLVAGNAGGASLWWEWTAPVGGLVNITTGGSSYGTLLGVYTGSSLASLQTVAANSTPGTGASAVSFTAQAGVTYEITLDGQNGASGATFFNLSYANDSFSSPAALSGESAGVTASTTNATAQAGEPKILGNTVRHSVWYSWTAPKSGPFQVSAFSLDFDPLVAVYTGSSLTSLSLASSAAGGAISTSMSVPGSVCACSFNAVAGTTYLITVDGKTDGATALNAGQFTLSIADSRWQTALGDGVTCSPAIGTDGTLYVGCDDHYVYALNPDGSLKWRYLTGGTLDTSAAALSNDGGTIYAGSADGYVYALTSSGALSWRYGLPSSPACSPVVAADGTVYIKDTGNYLYALTPSGTLKWRYAVVGYSYAAPVIGTDGTLYIGSDGGTLYALNPDGTVKWTYTADSSIYTAAALDAAGNLYFGSLNGWFYSVSPSGTQRWSYKTGNSISSSPALGADGAVYFGGYDHRLYALNTADGTVRWSLLLPSEVRASSPVVDGNGTIYLGCYDNNVYAVSPGGAVSRIFATGDWVRSSPVIFGTTLYFGSNDHQVYAFDIGADSAGSPWPMYLYNARREGRAVADALAVTGQTTGTLQVLAGASFTLTAEATGQGPLTFQWYLDGAAIAGATNSTYTVAAAAAGSAGSYTAKITGPQGAVTTAATAVVIVTPPSITAQPQGLTAAAGSSPVLSVSATGGALSYQWSLNGAAITGATGATLTLSRIGTSQAGSYTVTVSNAAGTASSSAAVVAVTYDARLSNLSARANVGTGDNVLIAGFVIGGTASKQVLLRGVGPGLDHAFPGAFPAGETLAAPVLTLTNPVSGATLATNSAWGSGPTPAATLSQIFTQLGAFALVSGSSDDALLETLGTGAAASPYTFQIAGAGGATGVALAEIYDADAGTPQSRLIDISARAGVGTGDKVLIGGFVIAGSTPETILIRAIGPGLNTAFPGAFQAGSTLASPVLTLYDSTGAVVASNTGWGSAVAAGPSAVQAGLQPATAAVMTLAGAFALPSGSADSAMVVTLPPGGYTAQVNGLNGGTGIALVEVYEVP